MSRLHIIDIVDGANLEEVIRYKISNTTVHKLAIKMGLIFNSYDTIVEAGADGEVLEQAKRNNDRHEKCMMLYGIEIYRLAFSAIDNLTKAAPFDARTFCKVLAGIASEQALGRNSNEV